ncbi:MAG: HPr family phosphocarrier protein [Candidatus Electrothrix sp. AR3]|nr:HPr family phosphocarrier protein [Candidatus Electrothrix sp. AR3]
MNRVVWKSRIENTNGVHCRVASRLTEIVIEHDAEVEITAASETLDGTSMLEILSLSLTHGSVVSFTAQGPDAQRVAQAIKELLAYHDDS